MKQVLKYVGYLLLLTVIGYMIWRFTFLIVWILLAAVLSSIGHPLVRFFDSLHIRKWRIPRALSAGFSLAILVSVIVAFMAVFVPLIIQQADTISKIDVNRLAQNLQGPIHWMNHELHAYGLIPSSQTIQDFVVSKAKSVVNLANVTNLLDSFFSMAGSLFIGIFAILFIAYFFMKDETMFEENLLLLIPVKHHNAMHKVLADSKNLLMRYFIGVLFEVISVMGIITVGLWLCGVENALLIGFFAGIMNIIPYLGPVIGAVIGITLGVTTSLASGEYNELVPIVFKLCGVIFSAHLIDSNILVPVIYSRSVKAHPLEIFFVIIIGGSLAGILGMLLAIPVYTVLRVIAREFFQQFRLVKKLTRKIK